MMIGDALRGEYLLFRDFSQRVTHPLAQEPAVFALRRRAVRGITAYALSAAASLSAIALLGWIAFFNNPLTPPARNRRSPEYSPARSSQFNPVSPVSQRSQRRESEAAGGRHFGKSFLR